MLIIDYELVHVDFYSGLITLDDCVYNAQLLVNIYTHSSEMLNIIICAVFSINDIRIFQDKGKLF